MDIGEVKLEALGLKEDNEGGEMEMEVEGRKKRKGKKGKKPKMQGGKGGVKGGCCGGGKCVLF